MSEILGSWKYAKKGEPEVNIEYTTELDIKGNARKIYTTNKKNNTLYLNESGFQKLVEGLETKGYKLKGGIEK